MLKFAPNQKMYVSRTEKGELFETFILSSVNNTLIISRPKKMLSDNKFRYIDYLEQKNLIYGRYMFNGVQYYFRTVVIKSNYTPFPYIILKYPDEKNIKIKKLRKYNRYRCILPLHVSGSDESTEVYYEDVFAVDISFSGIGIVCHEKLPQRFKVVFDSGKKKISLFCEVKVLKAKYFGEFHLYGCDIVKKSDEKGFTDYIDILRILNT